MNIFGLTPIDSSLSILGLKCAWQFIDLIFIKSHLGLAAFAIGFVIAVWQSSKEGDFKHFAFFIFISLLVFSLFIIPSSLAIKDTQALKISQTNTTPLILSYIAQMTDGVSISLISTIDKSLLNPDLSFLNNPFALQKLSLQANQALYSPIMDHKLRRELDDFIYAEYLPSLYKDGKLSVNFKNTKFDISNELGILINDPQFPWGKVKKSVGYLNNSSSSNDLDAQIGTSIIQYQITSKRQSVWFKWAGVLQSIFPYIQGGANLCLYIFFPFLLLVFVIFPRMVLLLRYLEVFVWIKSWVLTSAIAYYVSLIAANLQAQNETSSVWFWEYPYFALIEVVLLYVLPVITLISIYQSVQIFNNR